TAAELVVTMISQRREKCSKQQSMRHTNFDTIKLPQSASLRGTGILVHDAFQLICTGFNRNLSRNFREISRGPNHFCTFDLSWTGVRKLGQHPATFSTHRFTKRLISRNDAVINIPKTDIRPLGRWCYWSRTGNLQGNSRTGPLTVILNVLFSDLPT